MIDDRLVAARLMTLEPGWYRRSSLAAALAEALGESYVSAAEPLDRVTKASRLSRRNLVDTGRDGFPVVSTVLVEPARLARTYPGVVPSVTRLATVPWGVVAMSSVSPTSRGEHL